MRIVTENFQELTQTVCTTFSGMSLDEMLDLYEKLTKICKIGARPFREIGHSLQMKRNVYDFTFETVHYLIEEIFRDEEHGYDGEVMFVKYLEHTDGGTAEPETVEYTIPLSEFLQEIVGSPMYE